MGSQYPPFDGPSGGITISPAAAPLRVADPYQTEAMPWTKEPLWSSLHSATNVSISVSRSCLLQPQTRPWTPKLMPSRPPHSNLQIIIVGLLWLIILRIIFHDRLSNYLVECFLQICPSESVLTSAPAEARRLSLHSVVGHLNSRGGSIRARNSRLVLWPSSSAHPIEMRRRARVTQGMWQDFKQYTTKYSRNTTIRKWVRSVVLVV